MTSRKLHDYFEAYHRVSVGRYTPQPRGHRKNRQIGNRTWSPSPRLQASNGHQVSGTSRLHGRMEGKSNTSTSKQDRALDNVLWWLIENRQRRSMRTLHLSNRIATDPIWSLQQWSWVWSTIAWATPDNFPRNQKTTRLWRLKTSRPTSQQRMGHQQWTDGRLRRGGTKIHYKKSKYPWRKLLW